MSELAARTGLPAQAIEAIQQVLAACPAVEQVRIPRDAGHDSMLMPDSVSPSSRTPFHADGGQHSIVMSDT